MEAQLLKAVLCQGILFVSKDRVGRVTRRVLGSFTASNP
jgi:hypothetical protein